MRSDRRASFVGAWLLACVGVVGSSAQAQIPVFNDGNVQFSTFTTGFNQPIAIRFLGSDPNDFFVIEKGTGQVHHQLSPGNRVVALDLPVANNSERGLLGIALSPTFSVDNQVYLYHSNSASDGGAWLDNRLSRYTWNGGTRTLSIDNTFTPITFGTSGDGQAQGPNHDGGPMLFGPDGRLYGVTGDLNRNGLEQNGSTSSAFAGGIYRLNSDGSVPGDNPFATDPNTDVRRWYAYGVRNSFGLAFDPVTNRLWDTENGPSDFDEINLVGSGFNSGWTDLMGPDSRDPQGVGDLVALTNSFYSDPEFSFTSPIGITSIAFLAGTQLETLAYGDAVIVGDNNTQNLYLLRLNAARDGFELTGGLSDLVADGGGERNSILWASDFGVISDIWRGPDGALYITSLTRGVVYRVVPEPTSVALLTLGVLAAGALARRRLRARA